MKKAQMGSSVEGPSKKEKKRLQKSLAGVKKGFKPTSGPSFQNGGGVKKMAGPMNQPNPNPYSLKDKPVIKDQPSVKPTSPIGSRPVPVGTNESKATKTPMDALQKVAGMSKPGIGKRIASGVKKVVSNVKEAASERKNLKEYKKKVKNNNGMSPYTSGASFKTGGMVNSNAKIYADNTPGSKGVKSRVNKKVSKQTSPKGKVGGISSAPKTATPKAMYGMSMKRK